MEINNKIRRKKVSSSANKSTTSKSANSNSPRTKSSKKKSSKKKDKFKALRVTGIVLLVMLVCLSAAGTRSSICIFKRCTTSY